MTPRPTSRVLVNDTVLVVQPSVAGALGLTEALVIQQIHYWLQRTEHYHDGAWWVYNSVDAWQEQLYFLSHNTISRTLCNLEKAGYLRSANYNALAIDRTKWYTICYDAVEAAVEAARNARPQARPSRKNASSSRKNARPSPQVGATITPTWGDHHPNLGRPLPETTQETPSEITQEGVGVVGVVEVTDSPLPTPPPPPPPNAPKETTTAPALPALAVARYAELYPTARGSPALAARIRRDVIAAVGSGRPLTPAGLEHALLEASGKKDPWEFAIKVWRAKPNGPQGAPNGHLAPSGPPAGGPAGDPADPAAQERANADLLRALGGALPDPLRPAG